MSEETPKTDDNKITAVIKTKDPKRVEVGKRLAEISKANKERKLREKMELETEKDILFSYKNILALVGITIGAAALFYELYPRKVHVAVKAEEPQHVVINTRKDPPVKNTQLEWFG